MSSGSEALTQSVQYVMCQSHPSVPGFLPIPRLLLYKELEEENTISEREALVVSKPDWGLEAMSSARLDGCKPGSVYFAGDVFYDCIP